MKSENKCCQVCQVADLDVIDVGFPGTGEEPPSCRSGRCGSGVFRAEDSVLRGRRLWDTFGQISRRMGSVLGADRALYGVLESRAWKPRNHER